jgi:hypothetical protein
MDKDHCTSEQAQRIASEAGFTVDYLTWLADKLAGPRGAEYALPASQVLRWFAEGLK